MSFANDVRRALRQMNRESGIRQQDVARRLGVSNTRVSYVLNHQTDFKVSLIERFAEAMGFDVEIRCKRRF